MFPKAFTFVVCICLTFKFLTDTRKIISQQSTLISLIAEEAGINVERGGGAKDPELINEEVGINVEGWII